MLGDISYIKLLYNPRVNRVFTQNDFHLQIHYHANQTHFIRKVSHKDSFSNGGKRELGKVLCNSRRKETTDLPHSLVWYFEN